MESLVLPFQQAQFRDEAFGRSVSRWRQTFNQFPDDGKMVGCGGKVRGVGVGERAGLDPIGQLVLQRLAHLGGVLPYPPEEFQAQLKRARRPLVDGLRGYFLPDCF